MPSEKRLGRGLESLVGGDQGLSIGEERATRQEVDILRLAGNPFQPRKEFSAQDIEALADSIRQQGLLQPLLVREKGGAYEVIAGERRWRAAQRAGVTSVPVIVMAVDDQKMLEIALIENMQRKDLNPIEKALALRELCGRFNLSQEGVAQRVSLDRSTVTNLLRLLELPPEIQLDVSRETISAGHARALLGIPDREGQLRLAARIKKEQLSVRAVESIVRRGPAHKRKRSVQPLDPVLSEIEERLRKRFATKASIKKWGTRGQIILEFYTLDDFDRLAKLLGI
jgi:ParB family chromosome partitioning protein